MQESFEYDDAFDAEPQPVAVEDEDAPAAEAEAAVDPSTVMDAADRPVPRITIAAFCELGETVELMRAAAQDRRLARAHFTSHEGGLAQAIEKYHDEPTPDLIIVESGMRGKSLFDQLDELANVCDPTTKVIIVGAANDIALYRELMRRGVSEYLVPPLSEIQVIRSISELYADPEAPFYGKAIAFIGAKGGVGSSTIAHNLAWCVSESLSVDTTIVDLDLPFGTASLDFNQEASQGVAEALTHPERVDDVLLDRLVTRCTERLTLFTAPASLDREWELDPEACETVFEAVRKSVPVMALDLPHQWNSWVHRALLSSDEVVITATPDLASLRNAKNMFDLLKASRPNDAPPRVVLNQVGMPKRPEIPVKDFAEALGVEPALVLPFDAHLFGNAANNGQMIGETSEGAKVVEGMNALAALVTGRSAPPAKSASLIDKLFKRS
jgi:pilus assembly protein CpaE